MTLSPISDSTEADARRRFDELPSFDEPGWGIDSRTDLNTAPPTRAKRARPMPRRSFIKLLGGGAVAVGLTVVGWLPPLRLRRADALYDEWSDCHNFFDATTVCTPQSWWITEGVCSGSYYGAWHYHNYYSGDGTNGGWYVQRDSCGGRNAWNWLYPGAAFKCSDGETWLWGWWGSWNTMSICRTATYW